MNRRAFLSAMPLAILAAPLAGEAQQAAGFPRIGFLSTGSLSDARSSRYLQAFRQGLRELGYVEGQNIAIEFRYAAGKYDRLPGLAAEMVRSVTAQASMQHLARAKLQCRGRVPGPISVSVQPGVGGGPGYF